MVLAASTSVVWAFAFPLIKLGIPAFGIAPDDTGSKTLFAGVRFAAAGLLVSFISVVLPTIARRAEANRTIHNTQSRPGADRKGAARPFGENARRGVLLALLLGLVNTALHYFCYYIGLSNLTGSRSAVIDSLSSFLLILAACAVFRDERLTVRKAAGCVLGFAGILLVNAGGASSELSFMGDGMLLLSACFSACGGILTRVVTSRSGRGAGVMAGAATGVSLGFGGVLLIAAGLLMGGRLRAPGAFGVFVLCCLVAISTYGFSVYNKLISCNPVGEIAIFNSLIPILGVTFSCLLLGEPLRPNYAAAGALVAAGIFVINRRHTGKEKENENKQNTSAL